MKNAVVFILFTFTCLNGFSQSDWVESFLTRRWLNCQDVTYNMTIMIPDYYHRNSMDSLNQLLVFWESRCGEEELVMRCKILMAIDQGKFSESMYDEKIIQYLMQYRSMKEWENNPHQLMYYRDAFDEILKEFNVFTSIIAGNLLSRSGISETERFFLRFYANHPDAKLNTLNSFVYSGTVLQKSYRLQYGNTRQLPSTRFGFLGGAWIPEGKLATFGSHPVLGIFFGLQQNKSFYDLILSVGMGPSANKIRVLKDDSLYFSNDFTQILAGFKGGYDFLKEKNYSLSASAGIAYDGIEVLNIKDEDGKVLESKTLSSLNINAGLTYTFLFKNFQTLALDARYNVVNYANKGGTNVGGNYLQFSIIWGIAGNAYRDRQLRMLE